MKTFLAIAAFGVGCWASAGAAQARSADNPAASPPTTQGDASNLSISYRGEKHNGLGPTNRTIHTVKIECGRLTCTFPTPTSEAGELHCDLIDRDLALLDAWITRTAALGVAAFAGPGDGKHSLEVRVGGRPKIVASTRKGSWVAVETAAKELFAMCMVVNARDNKPAPGQTIWLAPPPAAPLGGGPSIFQDKRYARLICEDDTYAFSYTHYGSDGKGRPGLFVLCKPKKAWMQIEKVSTAGATLGRSPKGKEGICQIDWNFKGLADQETVPMPLLSEAIHAPNQIVGDTHGNYHMLMNSDWMIPAMVTSFIVKRAELDAAFGVSDAQPIPEGSPATQPEGAPISWGQAKDGVACGVSLDSKRYQVGEKVVLSVYLRNTGRKSIACNVSPIQGAWREEGVECLQMIVDALGGQYTGGSRHVIEPGQTTRILVQEVPAYPTANFASNLHFTPGKTPVVVLCTPLFEKVETGILARENLRGIRSGMLTIEVADAPATQPEGIRNRG